MNQMMKTKNTRSKDISVDFVDKMGDDKRVTNVARVSFSKWDDGEFSEKDQNLLNYLASGLPSKERDDWEKLAKAHTHFTPFAHCFLSVRVCVPIFTARQLHKHVIGLIINEESRRYIQSPATLFIPEVIHKSPSHAKQGASDEEHTDLIYGKSAIEIIEQATNAAVDTYEMLLDHNVAPEEARMVLPQNMMVSWIWSGSLLAFNRVYQQRIDPHAQKTGTQEFAYQLGKILYEHFPHSMEALNFGNNPYTL